MTKPSAPDAKRDGEPGARRAARSGAQPAARPDAHGPAADRVEQAARTAARRAARGARDPEPSLGRRLAQIGVLGWTILAPTLAALALGRWLDRVFASRVFFSAPLLMLGAALGFWLAWRWMKGQQDGDRDE
ncbi:MULTISPECIES: AtpZ/AtpI family protein [Burkholderia]|uniref:ATP synthase I n=1 Tax=Burkholderia mayonis TaxID=1385591 RepID=A0A1B4FP01_9BURK|nr:MULTISPECIES: AtpZ/AtpI family protein [Burkholderia]AOJ05393.1 ATP synthase I [Burkholderia mayonis]KVE42982.1 ATP synthase I [Burkholderia sp. BDU5]KVE47894.1 ATP synthase I [Burkholderia mayonis]